MDTPRCERGALVAAELAGHLDYLRRFARSRTRDEDLAEEAVQETMLAALQSRSGFAGKAKLRTWLTGILLHKIHDGFRRDARDSVMDAFEPHFEETLTASSGDPEQALAAKQLQRSLDRALRTLPPRQREAFLLREHAEIDGERLLPLLGVSRGNLWVLVHRARAHVRAALEREGYSIA
ncbi:MAG TPA: sigma-70 family RNA polymerase sigma factor [Usitatibacter sp.]|nr:sigma-70 family RNA polymerase sigma factor [Usitatibacter sp.]